MNIINLANIKDIPENAFIQFKKYGYLAGVITTILGVLIFLRPVSSSAFVTWLMIFGLLIFGIAKFFMYFRMPKIIRSGWSLAIGIMSIIAACILISDIANAPLATTISLQTFVGYFIGFECIFSGINSLCNANIVAAMGGSKGLTIAAGIIEIICGILVVCSPLLGLFTMTYVFGIFMTVIGIATIIRSIAY